MEATLLSLLEDARRMNSGMLEKWGNIVGFRIREWKYRKEEVVGVLLAVEAWGTRSRPFFETDSRHAPSAFRASKRKSEQMLTSSLRPICAKSVGSD